LLLPNQFFYNLLHCVSEKRYSFYFYDNFVRYPILLILDMIIGQSIYNVPTLTYLLETEIFVIVKYQLKCMVWPGAAYCWQGHQWVAWTAARLCESWWTTLQTFAL